jgi:hypothetical protein
VSIHDVDCGTVKVFKGMKHHFAVFSQKRRYAVRHGFDRFEGLPVFWGQRG